jgi:hypothetical protein
LLPVVSTIEPNLLDSAISVRPRMRDWMFSSVMSGGRLPKTGPSMPPKASIAGLDGDGVERMPSSSARHSAASSRLSWLV